MKQDKVLIYVQHQGISSYCILTAMIEVAGSVPLVTSREIVEKAAEICETVLDSLRVYQRDIHAAMSYSPLPCRGDGIRYFSMPVLYWSKHFVDALRAYAEDERLNWKVNECVPAL